MSVFGKKNIYFSDPNMIRLCKRENTGIIKYSWCLITGGSCVIKG